MVDNTVSDYYKYVIIGGGIAGISCQETLSALDNESSILLLTASPAVKVVNSFEKLTDNLHFINVEERSANSLEFRPNVTVLQEQVTHVLSTEHQIKTASGRAINYEKLCICTGAKPKLFCSDNPYVLGIRDTESISIFREKLLSARRIMVIGNGGIATELVYEIDNCSVIWAVKDESIVSAFVDPGAGKFFLNQLTNSKISEKGPSKRLKYTIHDRMKQKDNFTGSALGPDWLTDTNLHGTCVSGRQVHIEYSVEVVQVLTDVELKKFNLTSSDPFMKDDIVLDECWPVYVEFNNNKVYGCDFVISATGVFPNTNSFTCDHQFRISDDGGIKVNESMMSNIEDIYAAGDVASADWNIAPHWLQMRLWTQALQMGAYAAKSMKANVDGELVPMDMCFELFAHATKFFNFKVILLGRFNGQGLNHKYEMLVRVVDGVEYVKVILVDGKMQGAILIGDTDLDETFENLILNQTDLSLYGDELLNPDVDIQDYFD